MKKDLKKKILDSIKYAREELGFTLVSEDWGHMEHKCACALGCVLVQNDPKDAARLGSSTSAAAAANILEVSEKWIDSFIEGFDGNGTSDQSAEPDAWEMGFAIAKETKPIVYYTWDGEST